MSLQIATMKTPIGALHTIADGVTLLGLTFTSADYLIDLIDERYIGAQVRTVKSIAGITPLLEDYFDGEVDALRSIKTMQPGGDFSQRAWKAMRGVRAGRTISYSELAQKAGSPRAVRAAGSACAKNAIALVVPCHRILASDGGLGGYAYGVKSKEWLLRHEGAL